MDNIKVSVIIPTYKRSRDICRAVDSVLANTLEEIEVIVCDDNGIGTDEGEKTAQIMKKYEGDSRVIYLRHEKNQNGAAARNTGIKASRGKYIAFLDDDDAFFPERLEKMYNKLESLDSSYGACYSAYVKNMPDGTRQYSSETAEGDVFLRVLMRSLYIGTGSNLFFSRKAVEDIGLFDTSFLRNQDLEYLVRITKKYKMAYVDEVLMQAFYDIRTVKLTFEQSCERERLFREKFAPFAEGLTKKEKREIQIMYDLDFIRFLIATKRFGVAIKTIFSAKIPLKIYFAYLKYALDRAKNKTSYGFVVKL